jgi:hypothetical protein
MLWASSGARWGILRSRHKPHSYRSFSLLSLTSSEYVRREEEDEEEDEGGEGEEEKEHEG